MDKEFLIKLGRLEDDLAGYTTNMDKCTKKQLIIRLESSFDELHTILTEYYTQKKEG